MYGLVPEKILRLVYEPWSPPAPPKAGKPFYLAIIVEFVTFYEIIKTRFGRYLLMVIGFIKD